MSNQANPTPLPRPLVAFTGLVCASLACTIALGGPPIPAESAAPSPEAMASFNQKWRNLPEAVSNREFTLTFSEEEVASVAEAAIANAQTDTEPAIPLHSPQVELSDGITLYARTESAFISATGMMTYRPVVTPDGQLALQIESFEFGRASLGDQQLELVGTTIAAALTSPAENLPVSVVLTHASVVDGQLVLTGRIVE